jgi:hypothetical protein
MKATFLLALALSGMLASLVHGQAPFGLEALSRLDRLPVLRDSIRIGCVSSYDRRGNDDGFSGKHHLFEKKRMRWSWQTLTARE